jgi:uncharacterized protein (TIGR02145 family)/uncharacterized repeat protein (TIGR02543 family)
MCGGKEYNPLTEGCDAYGNIGTRCQDETVVPRGTPCGGYNLETDAIPFIGGNVTYAPSGRSNFAEGETVTLSAFPEDGYLFVGWGAGDQPDGGDIGATYRMSGNRAQVNIVAMFRPIGEGKLIAEAFPKDGGEVTRTPDEETYRVGETVLVTAEAKPGYVFDGWSGASESNEPAVTVIMDESKTLVAKFKPVSYNIRAAAEPADGGAVFINNTALPGDAALEVGTEITALARPAEGYAFERWSGAGAEGRTDNPATIGVAGDGVTITAHFKQQRSGGGAATPNLGGTFRDSRDGKTYRYVKIGNQTWMAENLNYADASIDGNGAWCYEDDESYCDTYGRLYDWATAIGVCPSGWHLPSRREWGDLVVYAGGSGEYGERGGFAGANLKSTNDLWYDHQYNTDAYNFSALPGGFRDYGGYFYDASGGGVWWTATENGGGFAYVRGMAYLDDDVNEGNDHASYGFSVRCMRDENSSVTPTTYTLTTNVSPPGGGTVSRNPNKTQYSVGEQVTVTATTASGYTFSNWTGASTSTSSSVTITMNGNKTLTANFTQNSGSGGGTPGAPLTYGGQTYRTVIIGSQTWMAENLNVQTADSWCYGENSSNCATYGRLYTWNAAMTACPSGWHLPSNAEWGVLVTAVGGSSTAGKALKSTSGWTSYTSGGQTYSGNGTDNYGFTALPGGYRGSGGGFNIAGYSGYWWSATEGGSGSAYGRYMYYSYDDVRENGDGKDYGFSVRCVGD